MTNVLLKMTMGSPLCYGHCVAIVSNTLFPILSLPSFFYCAKSQLRTAMLKLSITEVIFSTKTICLSYLLFFFSLLLSFIWDREKKTGILSTEHYVN